METVEVVREVVKAVGATVVGLAVEVMVAAREAAARVEGKEVAVQAGETEVEVRAAGKAA